MNGSLVLCEVGQNGGTSLRVSILKRVVIAQVLTSSKPPSYSISFMASSCCVEDDGRYLPRQFDVDIGIDNKNTPLCVTCSRMQNMLKELPGVFVGRGWCENAIYYIVHCKVIISWPVHPEHHC